MQTVLTYLTLLLTGMLLHAQDTNEVNMTGIETKYDTLEVKTSNIAPSQIALPECEDPNLGIKNEEIATFDIRLWPQHLFNFMRQILEKKQ